MVNNNFSLIQINNITEFFLDSHNWVDYVVSDLFNISIAKSVDKSNVKKLINGVNYITRQSNNNGLEYKVESIEHLMNSGNCITISMVGANKGTSFYQKDDFLSSQNMLILRNPNITKNVGLFLIPCLEKIYRISSDYNAIKKTDTEKTSIKLPSIFDENKNSFIPDWDYMEKFLSKLEYDLNIKNIKNKIKNIDCCIKKYIDLKSWKEYFIEDLFDSESGDFDIQGFHIGKKGEFVVSSGIANNGINGRTEIYAKIFDENTITVDMFGNTFYRYYKYKMVTHGRVFSLNLKKDINRNCVFYLSVILNNILPILYGYNNMCSWNKIKNEKILLPSKFNIDSNKYEPDWEYMESYITSIENELIKEAI